MTQINDEKQKEKGYYMGGVFRKFKASVYCPKPFVDKWNLGFPPRKVTGWTNSEIDCEACEYCKDISLDNLGVWCGYPTKKLLRALESMGEAKTTI